MLVINAHPNGDSTSSFSLQVFNHFLQVDKELKNPTEKFEKINLYSENVPLGLLKDDRSILVYNHAESLNISNPIIVNRNDQSKLSLFFNLVYYRNISPFSG